jgi:phenylacetate-CoA ligase
MELPTRREAGIDRQGRDVPTLLTRLRWSASLAREIAGQARLPFATPDAIAEAQRRRVRAMVAHAARTVPFYRDTLRRLGLRPEDFRNATDLARLPIVEREQLQRDGARLESSAVRPADRLTLRTGGSTGAPRAVHHSTRAIVLNAAHGERERTLVTRALGRRVGYRETVIGSPRSTAQEVQAYLRAHTLQPRGVRVERQYLSVLDPVERSAERLAEFAPDVVHGYGSYLAVLFAHLRACGYGVPLPRVATFSSDALSDAARALIRDELGVRVLGTYQAVEAFKIGFECGEGEGLHVNVDLYPVRVVDAEGNDVPEGEPGDLVVSNLVNDATVLLNYRLGDVAALLPGRCPCGRTLPRLTQPLGRLDDWLQVGETRVHSQAVRTVFTTETDILQYQVVQRAPWAFHVSVVTRGPIDEGAMGARVAAQFRARFGERVAVELARVDDLPRTTRGKVRAIVPFDERAQRGREPARPLQ